MTRTTPNLLIVLGPTASGKTRLGVDLARRIGGEILSADSRQVYQGMDIGTGKDLAEYGETPVWLIDLTDPGQPFSLFDFQQHFNKAFADIQQRGRRPILVGGSGLYLEAVARGYDLTPAPEDPLLRQTLAPLSLEQLQARLRRSGAPLHNTTDLLKRERLIRAIEIAEATARASTPAASGPEIRPLILGLHWERAALRQRIRKRLRQRLDGGLIAEVERLLAQGVGHDILQSYGLEYRFVSEFLQGKLNRNDLFQKLASAIAAFAKRQETWFRRMARNGLTIHWVEGAGDPLAESLRVLAAHGGGGFDSPTAPFLSERGAQ